MRKNYKGYLSAILSTLPEQPGCYQFLDENSVVIYVGKAKNLKRRVSSYFRKDHHVDKTRVLLKQIRDIKYVIVDSEEEALLLENNLIKQERPRYNVLLKDDKTYPYIAIKKEYFPRIFQTRVLIRDGTLYFGPYASAHVAKTIIEMITSMYKIRTCKLQLTPESINRGRYKACLNHHMKRCYAPCTNCISSEEYDIQISEIVEILKGNTTRLTDALTEQILHLIERQRFEDAQVVKEKRDLIENHHVRSTVVTSSLHNLDVFSFDENDEYAYINYMHIRSGAVVHVYTFEQEKKLNESKEELLGLGVVEMRNRFNSFAREIIVSFVPESKLTENVTYTIPKRGDRKKLLDLSIQNVRQYKVDCLKRAEKFNSEQGATNLLRTMQVDLNLSSLPMHIECFDNSNIQGTSPVAACVVFKDGKPSKSDYRHFHVKTVIGPDDFASMEEIVTRRYTRLLEENRPLPQLIVIDGGKGQLKVATEVLKKLNLFDKISIIGLAKKQEEIFYPGDPKPLILSKTSETLKVIQHLRDEAHRFGIAFHRKVRSKKQIVSELDSVKGIGEKTKTALLQKYKSVSRLRKAPANELVALIGETKTKILLRSFGQKENDNIQQK